MVGRARLELATSCVSGRRPNHARRPALSFGNVIFLRLGLVHVELAIPDMERDGKDMIPNENESIHKFFAIVQSYFLDVIEVVVVLFMRWLTILFKDKKRGGRRLLDTLTPL
jgi:hypothetical protein